MQGTNLTVWQSCGLESKRWPNYLPTLFLTLSDQNREGQSPLQAPQRYDLLPLATQGAVMDMALGPASLGANACFVLSFAEVMALCSSSVKSEKSTCEGCCGIELTQVKYFTRSRGLGEDHWCFINAYPEGCCDYIPFMHIYRVASINRALC